jgi:integrase
MSRPRSKPDGLPFRVYERRGKRIYSIGYKRRSGKWAFRYSSPITDLHAIAKLRNRAIEESLKVTEGDMPIGGFSGLVDAWFKMQESLLANDASKRAASTIAENKREAKNLMCAFGHLEAHEITRSMGYEYLEACRTATDRDGNLRPRPEKGNKEIALARIILEYGIRKNLLSVNPFDQISKNKTIKVRKLVTMEELNFAVNTGRTLGGPNHIVAMALKTAWLCVRRSVEVRGIKTQSIKDEGIVWTDGKDKTKAKILIEWSDELRETINEVLAIKRNHVAGSMYLFGNMRGQPYTKGGWKSVLDDLMSACVKKAEEEKIPFRRFSLQDCRPLGVTTKLIRGHTDTKEATGHSSEKMIATVYDRRELKNAKPAA